MTRDRPDRPPPPREGKPDAPLDADASGLRSVLVSDERERAELQAFLDRLLETLREDGVTRIHVRFGYAWEGRSEWREEAEVPLGEVRERIVAAETRNEGALGHDDLFLTPEGRDVQVQFCHHGDVHVIFDGPDALVEWIREEWEREGWAFQESRTRAG